MMVTDCAPAPVSSFDNGSRATGVSSLVVKVAFTAPEVGVTVRSMSALDVCPLVSVRVYSTVGTVPVKPMTGLNISVAASAGVSRSAGLTVISFPPASV